MYNLNFNYGEFAIIKIQAYWSTSEFLTRKKYIDVDLKLLGWVIGDDAREEVPLWGMPNDEEKGFAGYDDRYR